VTIHTHSFVNVRNQKCVSHKPDIPVENYRALSGKRASRCDELAAGENTKLYSFLVVLHVYIKHILTELRMIRILEVKDAETICELKRL
jgi:hypothetical protein